jgi:hypothetical protein
MGVWIQLVFVYACVTHRASWWNGWSLVHKSGRRVNAASGLSQYNINGLAMKEGGLRRLREATCHAPKPGTVAPYTTTIINATNALFWDGISLNFILKLEYRRFPLQEILTYECFPVLFCVDAFWWVNIPYNKRCKTHKISSYLYFWLCRFMHNVTC